MRSEVNLDPKELVKERIEQAKAAYTTRRADFGNVEQLLNNGARPKIGDLILARVEKIGQHQRIELANGRRARMFVGDEIVVAYGNRYAPDQFEAMIPDRLTTCHLVAAGGIASQFLTKHSAMKDPTVIAPIGLLGNAQGRPINLADFAMKTINCKQSRPLTLAVVGTTMNAGKTTTAASLIKGLRKAGIRTGAAKISGTGSGGDIWFMKDSGAEPVLDFVDAGFPSTYNIDFNDVERIVTTLVSNLYAAGVEAIVLEVADGLYQKETAKLMSSNVFRRNVDGIIFAASDAMGAKAGIEWLHQFDVPILAISGALTRSPLAIREAREAVDMEVLTKEALSSATVADLIKNWFPDWKNPSIH